jgi:hypothetical protein
MEENSIKPEAAVGWVALAGGLVQGVENNP